MKYKILYSNSYDEDDFVVEGETLEVIRELAAIETKKRNWDEKYLWSEKVSELEVLKAKAEKSYSNLGINTFAIEVHQNAVDHGWWEEQRSFGEIISLCHTELSEALEEHRNGRGPREIYFNESKPDKPEGIPTELADEIIRILDYCAREQIDIEYALKLKHEYNKTRPYRHGGKAL